MLALSLKQVYKLLQLILCKAFVDCFLLLLFLFNLLPYSTRQFIFYYLLYVPEFQVLFYRFNLSSFASFVVAIILFSTSLTDVHALYHVLLLFYISFFLLPQSFAFEVDLCWLGNFFSVLHFVVFAVDTWPICLIIVNPF